MVVSGRPARDSVCMSGGKQSEGVGGTVEMRCAMWHSSSFGHLATRPSDCCSADGAHVMAEHLTALAVWHQAGSDRFPYHFPW
jgi:hypothetical protein